MQRICIKLFEFTKAQGTKIFWTYTIIIPCFWTCTIVFLEVLWNTANTTEYKYDYHQYIPAYYVSTICYNHLTTVMPQDFCKEPSWLPILSPHFFNLCYISYLTVLCICVRCFSLYSGQRR